MHTVFYEVYFILDNQLFNVIKFLNAMHHRNYSCTFFEKSQVVFKRRQTVPKKIIDLFRYFQSAVKFLSVSFIMAFSPFLLIIT